MLRISDNIPNTDSKNIEIKKFSNLLKNFQLRKMKKLQVS